MDHMSTFKALVEVQVFVRRRKLFEEQTNGDNRARRPLQWS